MFKGAGLTCRFGGMFPSTVVPERHGSNRHVY